MGQSAFATATEQNRALELGATERQRMEFDRGEIEQLEKFARAVIQIDRRDDGHFRWAISQAVSLLGLSHQAVADEFDISRPTVTRWINGQNSPHPALRPVIYRWLAEQAGKQSFAKGKFFEANYAHGSCSLSAAAA